jgi:hypothetical protein
MARAKLKPLDQAYRDTAERWVCYPEAKITESCINGECSNCTKAPYRRKMTYREAKVFGAQFNMDPRLVNRGMLWRPVVRRSVPK